MYPNRKIKDKKRVGLRGPKQRYSVFRANLNRHWEKIFERVVRQLCVDNDLVVEEHMVFDERIPWECTWDKLRQDGYYLTTRSIQHIQVEVEKEVPGVCLTTSLNRNWPFGRWMRRMKGAHKVLPTELEEKE
jgi:hypothetical protein